MDKQIAACTSLDARLQTLGRSSGSSQTEQVCVYHVLVYFPHMWEIMRGIKYS